MPAAYRRKALSKLEEAVKITKDLIAAGAVGQEKRLTKLEGVVGSLKKLLDKEKAKVTKKEAAPPIAAAPAAPAVAAKSAVDQQKVLREERDNAIASADQSLTAGNFNAAIDFLEKAAALSEKMGEKDKAKDITKMANDIKNKLKKMQS